MSDWYKMEAAEVLRQMGTDAARGLDEAEAARRLAAHGPNALIERGLRSPWKILIEQLTAFLVLILIGAAIASAALGEFLDAGVMLAIVVLNAVLGLTQEYRAERAMAALKRLAVPTVKVRRGGTVEERSARDLAPGDVVLLEAGGQVPADGRLIESANLRLQEAALTGESEAVEKGSEALAGRDLPLGDRRNMVFMGTVVAYGRGAAVVTETGMQTELGGIATMIQTVAGEPTPLQRRLGQLGKGLALAAGVLVAIIFVVGLLRGGAGFENVKRMFLTAISMAVAAVPEGLPAVVTIALALGAQRMLRRRALIRKLLAVETLGSVTVICSDKTGTLTENRMTVRVLDVAGRSVDVSETLDRASAVLPQEDGPRSLSADQADLALLLAAGALCTDAALGRVSPGTAHVHAVGDPTEAALVVVAARFGLNKNDLEAAHPRVSEVPFDSERKRMTTVHRCSAEAACHGPVREAAQGAPFVAFTKGAVDSLLTVSTQVRVDRAVEPLTALWRERIEAANARLAQNGMRVLGVACRPLGAPVGGGGDPERDLIFVGLVGMIDPPRPEVKAAIETCRAAGIRPVMITGDHPLTAQYVARELGLDADGRTLTGQDLAALSVPELEAKVDDVSIYARVSPEHKLNIVQALQDRGQVVAMTGDGVNDAPALKKADIGVAMGLTGTDVAKEAADMVLQDDNFATIVAAVEEGRIIYDNIRKFIKYLLATNSGELWLMLVAPLLGFPIPLIPLQILWMNLVTDGLPAVALGFEPAERDIMRRRPFKATENFFAHGLGVHVLWVGLLMALLCIIGGACSWFGPLLPGQTAEDHERYFRTVTFTIVTLTQMAHVLAIRSGRTSLFRAGLLSNKYLVGAVGLTILLQAALIYAPFLQKPFQMVPLRAADLGLCVLLSSVVFWAVELEKWFRRRRDRVA
jgi:Ca2+-transporting ATPase